MENEIKVNDYIRTDDGRIYKLEDLEDEVFLNDKFYNNIVKHSPNLIDLIEVGDYVNGSKVIDIAQAEKKAIYTEDIKQKQALIPICEYEIKSIVTKEQFESISYKVERK